MKPNYKKMTRKELKEYLLSYRDDVEAWSTFFEKLGYLDQNQGYPPDLPTEEMEAIFRRKINQRN